MLESFGDNCACHDLIIIDISLEQSEQNNETRCVYDELVKK